MIVYIQESDCDIGAKSDPESFQATSGTNLCSPTMPWRTGWILWQVESRIWLNCLMGFDPVKEYCMRVAKGHWLYMGFQK